MPRSFKLLGWHTSAYSAYVDKGGSLTVHRLDAFKAGRSVHLWIGKSTIQIYSSPSRWRIVYYYRAYPGRDWHRPRFRWNLNAKALSCGRFIIAYSSNPGAILSF